MLVFALYQLLYNITKLLLYYLLGDNPPHKPFSYLPSGVGALLSSRREFYECNLSYGVAAWRTPLIRFTKT